MEVSKDFVIPAQKGQEIRMERDFIRVYFGVTIEFTTTNLVNAQRIGSEWIKLKGPEQSIRKAEAYIKGITNPEATTIFSIPEDVVASGLWNHQIVLYVIVNTLAVIRVLNQAQLFLQGTQLAMVQAISVFEDYINKIRHSILQNQPMVYQRQNQLYHHQPLSQYFPQYSQAGSHFDTSEGCNPHSNQDVIYRGAQVIHPVKNLPHSGNSGDVIAKEADLSGNSKLNENLRDFAQKLDYTDEQIKTAFSKFKESSNNQSPDENSLLQCLIQLYPRKEATPKVNTEGKVVKDSASTVASTQVQPNAKEVSTEEKNTVKNETPSNQELRHIVVDGSNVAMSHGNRDVFSCKGIKICVDYFKERGHSDITVFVPQWRKEASNPDRPIEDQHILFELENEQILAFTPSRRVNGQRVVCYDDRFIVKFAAENDGIIVSNDNFRDLLKENPEWKKVIDERLLMYTFVKDVFMVPDDPLGRRGPKLDTFLRKGTQPIPRICPYMKKCTYGSKCKFYHPKPLQPTPAVSVIAKSPPLSEDKQKSPQPPVKPAGKESEKSIQAQLEEIFPEEIEKIKSVIEENPQVTAINKLASLVLSDPATQPS